MPHDNPQSDRDKVIADTGWGIKPDDQPSNTREAGEDATRVFEYRADDPEAIRQVMKAQRRAFNTANRVRVTASDVTILDINGDAFVVRGLGYGDANLVELLKHLGASFSPAQLREVPAGDARTREYQLSRTWAWGAERTG